MSNAAGVLEIQTRITEIQSRIANISNPANGSAFNQTLQSVLGEQSPADDFLTRASGAAGVTGQDAVDVATGAGMSAASFGGNNAAIASSLRSQYDNLFVQAGSKYNINPNLLAAVAKAESGFNASAKSGAGAQGLMQIMPGTAKGLGVNALDPTQAVDGAAKMLSGLQSKFGSVELALAGYNAGPGAVQKYGGIPPYAETQNYVKKIMSYTKGIV